MTTFEEEEDKGLLQILVSTAAKAEVVLQELLRWLTFYLVLKVSLGVEQCYLDPSLPVSSLPKAFDMASEICARRRAATLCIV